MSPACQIEMTLPWGFSGGVLGVTVRLMSDRELRRLELLLPEHGYLKGKSACNALLFTMQGAIFRPNGQYGTGHQGNVR
jgi:hypothetical protein